MRRYDPGDYRWNKTPWHRQEWPRAWQISRLAKEQIEILHGIELASGRLYGCDEIVARFGLERTGEIPATYVDDLKDWCEAHFTDEMDNRIVPYPEDAVQGFAWFKTHSHLRRTLAAFHAFDWSVHNLGIPVLPVNIKRRSIDRVESAASYA